MRRALLASVIISFLLLSPPGAGAQEVQTEGGQRHAAPAVSLAVANTAIPMAVVLANQDTLHWYFLLYSWVVGPAPGLIYAGDAERAFDGIGTRLLTAGLAAGILIVDELAEFQGGSSKAADALLVIPAGITVASWIYDIAAIPPAVKRHNEPVAISPLFGSRGQVGVQVQVRW
jgi:hypothetical protein